MAQLTYDQIVAQIYETSLDLSLWPDLLETLRAHLGGNSATFTFFDRQHTEVNRIVGPQFDDSTLQAYQEHYHALDPWKPLTLIWPVGLIDTTERFIADTVMERSEYFQDFLRPLDGTLYAMGGRLLSDEDVSVQIGVQRTREQGPFSPENLQEAQRLAEHLTRAVKIAHTLLRANQGRSLLASAFDSLSLPILVADADARLLFANREAERVLRRHRGLRVLNGRLIGSTARETEALQYHIRMATCLALGVGHTVAEGVALSDPERPQAPLRAVILPMAAHRVPEGVIAQPAAALYLSEPDRRHPSSAKLLATFFGLTPAEARLACGLAEGASLEDIAEQQGVKVSTTRSQLSAIFGKTGTKRQAEVVRLVLDLAVGTPP